MSYIQKRRSSFNYAFQGICSALKEPNFSILVFAGALVTGLGFWFNISVGEWCLVTGCSVVVISLELFNSAIERLCNKVTVEFDKDIKFIKDACAAAVLVASAGAFIVGIIIFLPYFKQLFS